MTIATTSERFLAAPSRPSHPARSALIQSKGAGKARPPLRQVPQVQPARPGPPCAMGSRLLCALLGVRLDSHRRHEDDHPTGLAPASGRQDHAASRPQEPRSSARPSGHAARPRGHRIPASRLVTIAKRPLQAKRDGPRNHEFWKRESRFLPAAWTDRPIHLKARMKSVFRRSRFGG